MARIRGKFWRDAAFALCCCLVGQASIAQDEGADVVSVGGALTETVYALGMAHRLSAVDTSSVFPPQAAALPKVGYLRNLGAEGILALRPRLVLAAGEAGPPVTLQRIRKAGVRVETIAAPYTAEAVAGKIHGVAHALAVDLRGDELAARYRQNWEDARTQIAGMAGKPRVLFILAHGGGTVQVSGRGTAADAMIHLAGGINVLDGFEGYRPLTAEGAVTANPDTILLTTESLTTLQGSDGLWRLPGLALTTAGRGRRTVAMEASYLLGFGPRLPQAALELARRLHGSPP